MKNNSFEQGYNDAVSFVFGDKYTNIYLGDILSDDDPLFDAESYYKGRVEGLTKVIVKLVEKINILERRL